MSEEQERQAELSVQTRAQPKDMDRGGLHAFILHNLAVAGSIMPPWWSRQRDIALRNFVKGSDHLSGAINSMCARISAIPSRVEPRDATIKTHRKLAERYEITWNELSNFGEGKHDFVYAMYQDWATQDNGMFCEVLGDGPKDGPIKGPALGVAHLDAAQCWRTGNLEYPVIYTDTNGKRWKLHYTRVAFAASMSSTIEDMYGVGFCAASRCGNNAQHLTDIDIYAQEKMGSRPKRQMIITQGGLDPDDVVSALRMTDSSMNNQGLSRYSKAILIGDSALPDAGIVTVDLSSVPDGFDKQTSTTLGLFTIALALGAPVRWLWPASSAGATKADAMFQHIAGQGPGVGHFLSVLTTMLAGSPTGDFHLVGKFLPPTLKLTFDFQDDEQDRQVAENRKIRVEGWEKHLTLKTMDIRIVREQMLSAHDITDAQFRQLELADGRLPDGQSALTLFSATEPLFITLLDLGVPNPLSIASNDPAEMILEIDAAALEAMNMIKHPTSFLQKTRAEEALAALQTLKEMYSEILAQEIQEQEFGATQQDGQTDGQQGGQKGGQEDSQTQQKELEKSFNFGAGAGEVIRGKLGRGEGGRFVNVDEARAKIRAGIIARIRGKAGGQDSLSKAELKRQENREALAKLIPGTSGAIDALASMRSGEIPDAETAKMLRDKGFAELDDDGNLISTSAGRSLIRAANSGDIDAARVAIQQGKPKPKKAKKPKAAAASKPDPEQEKEENREKTMERISDKIPPKDFKALQSFREGGDLGDSAIALAAAGLVEFDSVGNPRFTSQGRSLMSSADKADFRAVEDKLSQALDRVEKVNSRADAAQERADKIEDQIDETEQALSDDIASIEDQIDEQTALLGSAGISAQEINNINANIEKLQKNMQQRMDKAEERIEELKERAEQQREKASDLLRSIGRKEGEAVRTTVDPELRIAQEEREAEQAGPSIPKEVKKKDLTSVVKERVSLLMKDGLSDYRLNVRAAVRSLWQGRVDRFTFVDNMVSTLTRNLRRAWKEGADRAGIDEKELTEKEIEARDDFINGQFEFLVDFSKDIVTNNRASGGKVLPLFERAKGWINRYKEAENMAFMLASRDKKLRWIYSPEKQHCTDCEKYNNRVYRASIWAKYDIHPRMWHLECKGIHCGCEFVETDDRATPGKPPKPKG